MRLPFKYLGRHNDDIMDEIQTEGDLNGDEIRHRLVAKGKEANLVWRTERNIRGINECPFDLVFGDERTLEMCAIEVKGDTDNYSRLSAQLVEYLFGFKAVYIALHKKVAPDWLPDQVGIIYVRENGDIYLHRECIVRDPLAVSTEYEWDGLFRANGLGVSHKRVRDILGLIGEIRNIVIFNRMFAVPVEGIPKKFEKFYPFSDRQREIIIGLDIGYHYKLFQKDLSELEKRFTYLKKMCALAQQEDTSQLSMEL